MVLFSEFYFWKKAWTCYKVLYSNVHVLGERDEETTDHIKMTSVLENVAASSWNKHSWGLVLPFREDKFLEKVLIKWLHFELLSDFCDHAIKETSNKDFCLNAFFSLMTAHTVCSNSRHRLEGFRSYSVLHTVLTSLPLIITSSDRRRTL